MLRVARPAHSEGGFVHQIVVLLGVSVLSGVLIAGLVLPFVGLVSKGADASASAIDDFPLKLKFHDLNERTKVLAADGTRIATFYDENRMYVPLDKISKTARQALIAIEDSRFYEHGAIDVKGTLRALITNQLEGSVVQGGSTITQQLVKMTRLENATTAKEAAAATEESKARKIEELRYAVWVEDHYTKDQILEHYLNTAYFGDGAYGIEAAAHHFFSVSAAQLNLTQSAVLAGLVKNPSAYNPASHPKAARNRRDTVLDRMLELHVLTTGQHRRAHQAPLGLNVTDVPNGCVNSKAPWFCDYLLKYLKADPDLGPTTEARKRLIYGGGLTIRSTVDLRFQRAADVAVHNKVDPTDKAIGGLAEVEPGTGYVRALSQSRPMGPKKRKGQTFLDYVVPTRYGDSDGFQAGSTFKAFVLTAAIKQGIPLNTSLPAPSTVVEQESDYTVCNNQPYTTGDTTWHVSNSTGDGLPQDLYSGTQQSVNTFYANLEKLTGLCQPWRLANRMGVSITNPRGADGSNGSMVPSFTLGFETVSPLEMAEAYSTFPARGLHCDATPVLEVRDRNGEVIPTAGPKCQRIMRKPEADAVNDILRGVQERGGFGYDAGISLDQPSAGKTGTVAPSKSVWFIGYTPTMAAASMIAGANRLGDPINLNYQVVGGVNLGDVHGSSTAGPMWFQAINPITRWLPDTDFHAPDVKVIKGQTLPIPSFYGYSPSTAAAQLTKLGFITQIASQVYSSAPYGTVAYTSPSGEGVSGETVTIYVSIGQPPPPVTTPPTTPPPTTSPPTTPPPTTSPPTTPPPTTSPPTTPPPTTPPTTKPPTTPPTTPHTIPPTTSPPTSAPGPTTPHPSGPGNGNGNGH
ncbi:MAG: penicillin-binding protein [Nocardioidaceae bacterium]